MLRAVCLFWEVDDATVGSGARNLDGLTGDHVGKGRFQMLAPFAERTMVGDRPVIRVDHEYFTGSLDTQRLANNLSRVHQYRNIETEFFGSGDDAGPIVAEIGVDHEKLHALLGVLVAKGFYGWHRVRDQIAVVGLCHQHDGFCVAEIVKFVGRTRLVQEPEIIDSVLRVQGPARDRDQKR